MSDLENDIKEALARHPGIVWDMASIIEAIVKHLTALGYTRAGLTEAQREAERKRIVQHCIDLASAFLDMQVSDAIDELKQLRDNPHLYGPALPIPKPARRVVQVALAASSYGSWPLALCDDGTLWGMPDGTSDVGTWKKLPSIPGDDA